MSQIITLIDQRINAATINGKDEIAQAMRELKGAVQALHITENNNMPLWLEIERLNGLLDLAVKLSQRKEVSLLEMMTFAYANYSSQVGRWSTDAALNRCIEIKDAVRKAEGRAE